MQKTRIALIAVIGLGLSSLLPAAFAAPSLEEIQVKVQTLQEEATSAAEGAQAARVQLDALTRTLNGIKQQAAAQGQTVEQLRKSLGSIAVSQYKAGGLSEGLELLFSSDPTLYLSAAGSLNAITRYKSVQLRRYTAATQRLNATTFTVNDKLALVKSTQARLIAKAAEATSKLAQAEKILAQLKQADRERLARLAAQQEDADQASSLALAKQANGVSGRAGLALKFALKQIGDRYVFGAAGPTLWDCSGLTMRAYGTVGVSMPHSAAAQFNYGKRVSLNALRAGDLVFFGRPISHVGIYLGGGRMVHAPRSGSRVKITEMMHGLGSKPLVGARRF